MLLDNNILGYGVEGSRPYRHDQSSWSGPKSKVLDPGAGGDLEPVVTNKEEVTRPDPQAAKIPFRDTVPRLSVSGGTRAASRNGR